MNLSVLPTEQADSEEIPDETDIPQELRRHQDRLNDIAQAKATIEDRAAHRYAQEQKEYEEKATARRAKAEASGKKPRGPEPKPPTPGPRKKDQVNLTDEESRVMPSSDKGFVQAYNAQASVDVDTFLRVHAMKSSTECFPQVVVQDLSHSSPLFFHSPECCFS